MTYRKPPQLWAVTLSARSACFFAVGRAKRRPVEELELQILLLSQRDFQPGICSERVLETATSGNRWGARLEKFPPGPVKIPWILCGWEVLKIWGLDNFSMIARALFEYEIRFPWSRRHTTISANQRFSMTFKEILK